MIAKKIINGVRIARRTSSFRRAIGSISSEGRTAAGGETGAGCEAAGVAEVVGDTGEGAGTTSPSRGDQG